MNNHDIDSELNVIATLAGSVEGGCALSDDLESLRQRTADLSLSLQKLDGSSELPLHQPHVQHRYCWTSGTAFTLTTEPVTMTLDPDAKMEASLASNSALSQEQSEGKSRMKEDTRTAVTSASVYRRIRCELQVIPVVTKVLSGATQSEQREDVVIWKNLEHNFMSWNKWRGKQLRSDQIENLVDACLWVKLSGNFVDPALFHVAANLLQDREEWEQLGKQNDWRLLERMKDESMWHCPVRCRNELN